MIPGFDPQTIDCSEPKTEPTFKDKVFVFGSDAYGTTCYEKHAELWKRILDWSWDPELHYIEIDPKNIRFTKGFTVSQELIDADRDRSN